MKHITEQYGEKANYLEMSADDFHKLKAFLKEAGVEIRMCSMSGADNTAVLQVRNVYKDNLICYSHIHDAAHIRDMSDREVTSGRWCL